MNPELVVQTPHILSCNPNSKLEESPKKLGRDTHSETERFSEPSGNILPPTQNLASKIRNDHYVKPQIHVK